MVKKGERRGGRERREREKGEELPFLLLNPLSLPISPPLWMLAAKAFN